MSANVIGRPAWVLLVGALGLLLAGCADRSGSPDRSPATLPTVTSETAGTGEPASSEAGEPSERAKTADPGAGPSGDPGPADPITVRVLDETELAQVLRQHQGKVVLVDFWATWCRSCLELFPHTVELSQRFADRGLVVISVSIDDPEQEASVLESLTSNGATCDNFISRYGGSTKTLDAFELEDGVLPIYRFYDRTGKVSQTLRSSQGPVRAEDVDRVVEELLGRPSSLP